MNKTALILALLACAVPARLIADPALTIYNQNFAVVRDTVPLDLKEGVNDVSFADTTAHLEPDSVILRDPSGKVNLQVLEQNYRNDPVSQELLLSLFEGKTIDFLVKEEGKPDQTIQGKIIRSGLCAPFAGGHAALRPAVLPSAMRRWLTVTVATAARASRSSRWTAKSSSGCRASRSSRRSGTIRSSSRCCRGSSPPTRPASSTRSSPTSPAA